MMRTSHETSVVDRRINAIVADRMKQSLIVEYMKKHPGANRDEVFARMENGEWVVSNISSVLEEMFKRKDIRNTFEQRDIIREMEMESDERYKACQFSLKNSKRIIDFLFQSSYASFGLRERNQHRLFLNQHEKRCADAIFKHFRNKREILEIMTERRPEFRQVKLKVLDFFDALHKQLNSQYKIFDREISLNNEFSGYSKSLIKDHIKQIHTQLKDSKKKKNLLAHIARAYKTLKENGSLELEEISSISLDQFNGVLQNLDRNMSQKREELEVIQKVVFALEKVVEYLEASAGKKKQYPVMEKLQKQKSSRMAFAEKMTDMFSRVKKGFQKTG